MVILGKGHENYQIIGTEKKHFSDQAVVRDYLAEMYSAGEIHVNRK